MSRSRKKTPIYAMTLAASDKRFKQAEHRRERAAVKIAVTLGQEPAAPKEYGNPWHGEKDGKAYRPDQPDLLRK